MPSVNEMCEPFISVLDKKSLSISVPLSILLIPLEALIDKDFSCPCKSPLNAVITNLIFIAPFVFVFALMCIILQLMKHEPRCSISRMIKTILLCLLPPFVWIMLVFLDGDYFACYKTDWEGVYVYDDKLDIKWCTSVPVGGNETEHQTKTLSFIANSQIIGFSMLLSLGIISTAFYIYCCCCCSHKEPQYQEQTERQAFTGTFVCHRQEPDRQEPGPAFLNEF